MEDRHDLDDRKDFNDRQDKNRQDIDDRNDGDGKHEPRIDDRIRIIIDGTPHVVATHEIDFDTVVNLAYPDGGRGELITYTVTYYNGDGSPSEGALAEGEKTKIKNGTVFNVTRTDRS